MDEIVRKIRSIYKNGNISYLLFNYVDKNFYYNNLKELFPYNYIYNQTDFNYEKCIFMVINLSQTNAEIATPDFREFINKNGSLYQLTVEVSLLSPYCVFTYCRYYLENNLIKLEEKESPFISEHEIFDNKIKSWALYNKLIQLKKEILDIPIPGIKLELRKKNVTVYNCLFADFEA